MVSDAPTCTHESGRRAGALFCNQQQGVLESEGGRQQVHLLLDEERAASLSSLERREKRGGSLLSPSSLT